MPIRTARLTKALQQCDEVVDRYARLFDNAAERVAGDLALTTSPLLGVPRASSAGTQAVKPLDFSRHALEQMAARGAAEAEVAETIRSGEAAPAKSGRRAYRKDFPYDGVWSGRVKISYDPRVDALYIRLVDEPGQVTTKRLSDDVAVDYGSNGGVVGIEILDAASIVFPAGGERSVLVENLTAISG